MSQVQENHYSLLVGDKLSSLFHFSEYLLYDLIVNKDYEPDYPQIYCLNSSSKSSTFSYPAFGKALQNLEEKIDPESVYIDLGEEVKLSH